MTWRSPSRPSRLAPRHFEVCLDDRPRSIDATLIAVGNTPQYGGGKKMTPSASMVDGRFAVTVVGPVTRRTLARLAPTLPRAGHIGHPAVTTYEASRVSLDAPATVAYADGERLQELPVVDDLRARCAEGARPDPVAAAAPATLIANAN